MSIAVNVNDPTNSGVNNTKSTTGSNSLTGSNASDLQGSFLTLLVAQLKNQDPTNPMQNNELTTQLAQISTVSGIEKLNTTLGSVSGQINSAQSLQAASLIGHADNMAPVTSAFFAGNVGGRAVVLYPAAVPFFSQAVPGTTRDYSGLLLCRLLWKGALFCWIPEIRSRLTCVATGLVIRLAEPSFY